MFTWHHSSHIRCGSMHSRLITDWLQATSPFPGSRGTLKELTKTHHMSIRSLEDVDSPQRKFYSVFLDVQKPEESIFLNNNRAFHV